MFTAYLLLLTINEYSMQLNRTIYERQREYEILIDGVVNSQKGVIGRQLITSAKILGQIKLAKPICPANFLYLTPRVPLFNIIVKNYFD